MDREKILALLGPAWDRLQNVIRDALLTDVPLLREANRQVLENSGKMLRPMVSLLMAGACGIINESSISYAAAAEMLHNATLMHDDVADGSSERRGHPSVMSMIGADSAVLMGDFWLARAVEMVLKGDRDDKVTSIFSKTLTDLAEGEMLQLQKASSADTTEEDYMRIIYCKTASLFEAACVSGAISVGAPDTYVEAAGLFARNMGLAFQIKDDILDYSGDDTLGKPAGVDLKEKKITLPLLSALEANPSVDNKIREMVCNIDSCPVNCGRIHDFVIRCGGVEMASDKLGLFVGRAVDALSPLPDSPAKDMLADIVRFNMIRRV